MTKIFEYRPLESGANWRSFLLAKKNQAWHEPNLERGAFLVLHSLHALHDTVALPSQSLNKSWLENDQYFQANDRQASPPLACMPIYLISVGSGNNERIVYIGKTTSSSSRFIAGHKAMTLLHAPKYEGQTKRLYRCCIVFRSDRGDEIPIEWITPYEAGKKLLLTFESILIYHFQPELNKRLKNKLPQTLIGSIHIQNVIYKTEFLNDEFIFP